MRMFNYPTHCQFLRINPLFLNDSREKMMVTRGLPCTGKLRRKINLSVSQNF